MHAHPSIGGQRRLPSAAPGHLVGQVDEGRRAVVVTVEPLAEGRGELLVLRPQREVHGRLFLDPDIGVTLVGPGYRALP